MKHNTDDWLNNIDFMITVKSYEVPLQEYKLTDMRIRLTEKAKQQIRQALFDRLPEYRDITDDPQPHPQSQDIYDTGYNKCLDNVIKVIQGEK